MQVSEQLLFVPATDGTRLAITLYLPEGDGPFATLLEALPYRMNDVTSSYADGYVRFRALVLLTHKKIVFVLDDRVRSKSTCQRSLPSAAATSQDSA